MASMRRLSGTLLALAMLSTIVDVSWAAPPPRVTAALVAGPSSEPALEPAHQLAVELAFRRDFGLIATASHVSELMATPEAYEGGFGVALAPDELADMQRRMEVQNQLDPLRTEAEGLLGFAGLWLDQLRGGTIVVAFSGEGDRHKPLIDARAPAEAAVEIVEVEYSWAQLSAVLDRVEARRLGLKAAGLWIRELGIDPQANQVEIGLDHYTKAAEALLRTEFGDTIAVRQSGNPTLTACTDRAHCIGPPVRAGIATTPSGCSLGFLVKVAGAPGTGWLTAGHPPCGNVGQVVSHNGVAIGTIRASCWDPCLRSDAALGGWLNSTYASDRVYRRPQAGTQVNIVQISTVGMVVCLNGRRQPGDTGWRCGKVDSIKRVDYGNHYFLDQRYATFHAYTGDSGGAVHSGLLGDGRVNALGIQSGCENLDGSLDGCEPGQADGLSIFSAIHYVTAEIGAQYGATVTVCRAASTCP